MVRTAEVRGILVVLLIIVSAAAVPFAKSQHTREIWYYLTSGEIAAKILTVEFARIFAFMK